MFGKREKEGKVTSLLLCSYPMWVMVGSVPPQIILRAWKGFSADGHMVKVRHNDCLNFLLVSESCWFV